MSRIRPEETKFTKRDIERLTRNDNIFVCPPRQHPPSAKFTGLVAGAIFAALIILWMGASS